MCFWKQGGGRHFIGRQTFVFVKRQSWGESCRIRLWEREAYVLNGARTSPKGEVRESKHAVEPGANSTGPCGRPHGRQFSVAIHRVLL
jgi:hypothetical protein